MRPILLLVLLAACSPDKGGPSADDDTGDAGDTGDTGDAGDSTFDDIRAAVAADLNDNFASGASVAIWYQGQITFAEGFGSAHPDHQQDVLPTTRFQIGSDTKKLTAVAHL